MTNYSHKKPPLDDGGCLVKQSEGN